MPEGRHYGPNPRRVYTRAKNKRGPYYLRDTPPPNRKKNMRKTTRKGAYKPARKKQMSIRRAPLVETFKYQSAPDANSSVKLSKTSAYNNILNQAFIAGYRQDLDVPVDGASTTQHVGPTCRGRDIFSKLTALKMRFEFPEDIFSIRTAYMPPQVIHGWVKKTAFRTTAMTPPPLSVNEDFFKDLIDDELTGQYDQANDRLDFADRRPTQYKILGKRKIYPNRNKSISQFQNGITNNNTIAFPHDQDAVTPLPDPANDEPMSVLASLPPVFHTCRWKTNRKIGLQRTENWTSATTDDERFYPADCWIPFVLIFNPSFANQIVDISEGEGGSDRGAIQVSYNSVHYYTDS